MPWQMKQLNYSIGRILIRSAKQPITSIKHSARQMEDLICVYRYLCTLNSLQSTLKLEKETEEGAALHAQGLDDISHLQKVLSTWEIDGQAWTDSMK